MSRVTRVPDGSPSSSPARPSGPSSCRMPRACCAASTSVGASRAACPPASTTCGHRPERHDRLAGADLALQQAVHRAGRGRAPRRAAPRPRAARRSARTGARRRPRRAGRRPRRGRAMPGSSAAARRRAASVSCRISASSHFSRCRAALDVLGGRGPVDVEEGGRQPGQPVPPAHLLGQRVVDQLARNRPRRRAAASPTSG